jgi:hypothetical protein
LLGTAESGDEPSGDLSPWPEDEGSDARNLEDVPSESVTRLQNYHMLATENKFEEFGMLQLKETDVNKATRFGYKKRLFIKETPYQSKTTLQRAYII